MELRRPRGQWCLIMHWDCRWLLLLPAHRPIFCVGASQGRERGCWRGRLPMWAWSGSETRLSGYWVNWRCCCCFLRLSLDVFCVGPHWVSALGSERFRGCLLQRWGCYCYWYQPVKGHEADPVKTLRRSQAPWTEVGGSRCLQIGCPSWWFESLSSSLPSTMRYESYKYSAVPLSNLKGTGSKSVLEMPSKICTEPADCAERLPLPLPLSVCLAPSLLRRTAVSPQTIILSSFLGTL